MYLPGGHTVSRGWSMNKHYMGALRSWLPSMGIAGVEQA